MKKNILFALPLSALVIACAQQGTDQMAGCQTMTIPAACNGPPDKPKININVKSGRIAPPNVCTYPGRNIQVTVTPNNTKVIVVTVQKDPVNTWMSGINRPNPNKFDIKVPATVLKDDKFDYHIVATNGLCYDPRITVN